MKHPDFAKRFNQALSESSYAGRSQKDVGKCLGVSQPTVNEWIKGEKLPSMKTGVRIAAKFRCGVEWLMTGKGEKSIGFLPEIPVFASVNRILMIAMSEVQIDGRDLSNPDIMRVCRACIDLDPEIKLTDDELREKIQMVLKTL